MFHIDDIIDFKSYQQLKTLSKDIYECNQETLNKWRIEKTYEDVFFSSFFNIEITFCINKKLVCPFGIFNDNKYIYFSSYHEYILHHISMLPTSSSEREERSCYLLYLHFLMILFNLLYKDIRKKGEPFIFKLLKRTFHFDNVRSKRVIRTNFIFRSLSRFCFLLNNFHRSLPVYT